MEWIKEKESTRHLQTGYLTGSNQEGSFEAKNLCFQWAHQRSLISFDKLDVGKRLQIENKKGENTLPASKAGGPKTLNAANNNGDIAIEFVSG